MTNLVQAFACLDADTVNVLPMVNSAMTATVAIASTTCSTRRNGRVLLRRV